MIESEAAIRRAVTRVQNAYPSGGGAWARTRFEEWVNVLIDLDPDAVTTAVTDLIREWTDDYGRAPQPGHLVDRARTIQRQMHADQIAVAKEHRDSRANAPTWYARLVMATVIRATRARGVACECPARTVPYLQIADQYDLLPRDMSTIPPRSSDQRVKDAHLEAERYGLLIDPGTAGAAELREMVGLGGPKR